MVEKRPPELVEYNEAATKNNDTLIINALAKLEDDRAGRKFKPTVATLCELTGLSRNTVRNRSWALMRLRSIKSARRINPKNVHDEAANLSDEESLEERLRMQLSRVLGQNALLYEEILLLRGALEKSEREIQNLKNPKLKLV